MKNKLINAIKAIILRNKNLPKAETAVISPNSNLQEGENAMLISVNRDSVCMGDDVESHVKNYKLDDDATYEDLFKVLVADFYFPNVSGGNVVWVMNTEKHNCVFSFFTLTNRFSKGLEEMQLKNICEPPYKVWFDYYCSPQKWKDKIYKMRNNDDSAMWHDRWSEEIKHCDYCSMHLPGAIKKEYTKKNPYSIS